MHFYNILTVGQTVPYIYYSFLNCGRVMHMRMGGMHACMHACMHPAHALYIPIGIQPLLYIYIVNCYTHYITNIHLQLWCARGSTATHALSRGYS